LGQKEQHRQTDVSRRVFGLEDIKFNSCVRLSQFERDRSIAFIPPDGEFNPMRHRPSAAIKPIICIDSTIERNERSRVEMLIHEGAQYRPQSVAQNVTIHIRGPSDVDAPEAQCTAGRMRSSPNDSALVWTITQFPGRTRFTLRAHFGLPFVESDEDESKRPIVVAFEIPFFAVSAAPSTSHQHPGRRNRGERLDLRREDTALWAPGLRRGQDRRSEF
jgi:AP-1 complex subunit mu